MYYFYNPSQNRIEKRPVSAAFLTKTYKKKLTAQGLFFFLHVCRRRIGRILIILSLFEKK